MLGVLEKNGLQIVTDPQTADILLVNTCGFIQSAVEEAVETILQLAEYKKQNPVAMLVVVGCLVQRYRLQLQEELPEVDLFVGTDDYDHIHRLIQQAQQQRSSLFSVHQTPQRILDATVPRRLTTPSHRGYLKLTEGCDNRCTYCLIPSLRGPLRSREIADLVREARQLEDMGVKELTLIAQDLTAYGNDKGGTEGLPDLLRRLHSETSIPWIRLLYLYPDKITDVLLDVIADSPRILPYLDIPIQHVATRVLRRMNRQYDRQRLEELFAAIRLNLPDAALRTTLMVGFPGETDDDFEELLAFVQEQRMEHVGVFQYEDEEESAAYHLGQKCSPEIKEERFHRLMQVQADISQQLMRRFVGKKLQVLVEGVSSETDLLLEARTWFQAADIDGVVYISRGTANPGDLVEVTITEAHPYDLVGEIGKENEEVGSV